MSENGEIYTADKNFTLPPAVTALTNSTSDCYLEVWFFSGEYDCQVSTTPPIAVTIFLNVKGELRTSNHQNILSPDKKSHSTELDAQIFMDIHPQSQKQSYLERQKFTFRWKFFFLTEFLLTKITKRQFYNLSTQHYVDYTGSLINAFQRYKAFQGF